MSIGVSVMLQNLCGNKESVDVFTNSIGKVITKLNLGDDDALHFEFADGSKMQMLDNGQTCCEYRYMRTDDDLEDYVGARLLGAEIKEAPPIEYDHEVEFLEIQTDRGVFTMSNHNEHNGYYGGFYIMAKAE